MGLAEYSRCKELRFEVQVRTIVQDAWSVLDHKIKYKKNIPLNLRRRINRLAALFELADQEFSLVRDETANLERDRESQVLSHGIQTAAAESPLDAPALLSMAKKMWPSYEFVGKHVDGFVEEIRKYEPQITTDGLEKMVEAHNTLVGLYAAYQLQEHRNNLNPYTQLRHILYLAEKVKFKLMLYDMQRSNLEKWLGTRM